MQKTGQVFWKYNPILVTIILILLGFYIRFINLTDYGFYNDEAIDAVHAINLNWHNLWPEIITEAAFFHLVVLKISFSLLNISEFAARLPSLIFSLGTIFLIILLGNELHSKKVGHTAGFLLAISAWFIKWSIISRPYSLVIFLSTLIMYLIYLAIKTNSPKYYLFMSVLLPVALLSSRFCLVLPVIVVIYILFVKKWKNKWLWISLTPAISISILITAYTIWHRDFNLLYNGLQGAWWSHSQPSFYANLLFNKLNILALLSIFYGVYKIVKSSESHAALSIIYVSVFYLAIGYFFFSKIDRYMSFIIPFVYLLISYGGWELIHIFKKNFNLAHLFSIIFILLICLGDLRMLTPAAPEKGYRDNYRMEWREAYQYTIKRWKDDDYLIVDTPWVAQYYFPKVNHTPLSDWEKCEKLIWRTGVGIKPTVWIITGKYGFYGLQSWQQDWIWRNFELVWESEHNYVFKNSVFEKIWKEPCDILRKEFKNGDVIISTDRKAIQGYLQLGIYDDWNAIIDKYHTTVRDAIWRNGIPENVTVWFIADKDNFFNLFKYWQRDWILRNFKVYWESEYTYLFKND